MRYIKTSLFGLLLLHLMVVSCQPQVEPVLPNSNQSIIIDTLIRAVAFEGNLLGAPITYKNLQLFPITGKGALDHVSYLTLGVAMETNKVIVHETGNVNSLSITNNSDQYVYIQSGDIVKGGRQDRTIQYDVLIPPKAKNMSLNSFCVEQSRWSKRGNEVANQFSSSKKMLSNREIKLAAKSNGDQGYVLSSVVKTQNKINGTLKDEVGGNADVTMNASATSLQLALENEDLTTLIEDYKTALEKFLPTDSLLGFAYAINGVFYGVELYNNSFIFMEMKNKLIESVVTEAISDKKKNEDDFEVLTLEDLLLTLNIAVYKSEEIELNKACKWVSSSDKESKMHKYILIDLAHGDKWLHKNWVNGFGLEEKVSPVIYEQFRSSNHSINKRRMEPTEHVERK